MDCQTLVEHNFFNQGLIPWLAQWLHGNVQCVMLPTSTYQAMNETMWLDKIQDFFYQRFLKLQLNSLGWHSAGSAAVKGWTPIMMDLCQPNPFLPSLSWWPRTAGSLPSFLPIRKLQTVSFTLGRSTNDVCEEKEELQGGCVISLV